MGNLFSSPIHNTYQSLFSASNTQIVNSIENDVAQENIENRPDFSNERNSRLMRTDLYQILQTLNQSKLNIHILRGISAALLFYVIILKMELKNNSLEIAALNEKFAAFDNKHCSMKNEKLFLGHIADNSVPLKQYLFLFVFTLGFGLSMTCASKPIAPVIPTVLPQIIAHRAGTEDAPENTLEAIRLSIAHHTDGIWLTVQLSSDGIPVLYRPDNLDALTNVSGPVAHRTAAKLARVNAGWNFKDEHGNYPYRNRPATIPTLREALRKIPANMSVVLDMKALPAERQARAVAQILTEENMWSRVMIYSTDSSYQKAFAAYPQARLFEARDATRDRLIKTLLNEECENTPSTPIWVGFELHRKLTVTEKFTLGEGTSLVNGTVWTPKTIACFRRQAPVKILAIAINNELDYQRAACLGLDAVLADSPRKMVAIKTKLKDRSLQCEALAKKY